MEKRKTILDVKDLQTSFFTDNGEIPAVDHVDFHIREGEVLGIVGASGCGKIVGGEILFEDDDLLKKSEKKMQKIRGNEIAMIFQEPMTSLNPLFTIGNQMTESMLIHNKKWSKKQIHKKAVEMLQLVGLPRS